jgi:hypothetical protein
MESLDNRLKVLELVTELNSLMIETEDGSKEVLLRVNPEDIEYVHELVSPLEYENKVAFLRKVKSRVPLLKTGSEKKETLSVEDYIQYS